MNISKRHAEYELCHKKSKHQTVYAHKPVLPSQSTVWMHLQGLASNFVKEKTITE